MIDPHEVKEIIKLYAKHGWTLRRVLLSADLSALTDALGDAERVVADIDGLWFTRRSEPESETWELRRLGGTPYALLTVVGDDADESEREAALDAVVRKMRATVRGN